MECGTCTGNLTAFADDELSLDEKSDVSLHLQDCKDCNSEYRSLLYSQQLVDDSLVDLDLPAGLWSRIAGDIQPVRPPAAAKSARTSFWPSWSVPFRPAAFAGLAIVGAIVVLGGLVLNTRPADYEVRQGLDAYVKEAEKREQVLREKGLFSLNKAGFFQNNPFCDDERHEQVDNPFLTKVVAE